MRRDIASQLSEIGSKKLAIFPFGTRSAKDLALSKSLYVESRTVRSDRPGETVECTALGYVLLFGGPSETLSFAFHKAFAGTSD